MLTLQFSLGYQCIGNILVAYNVYHCKHFNIPFTLDEDKDEDNYYRNDNEFFMENLHEY